MHKRLINVTTTKSVQNREISNLRVDSGTSFSLDHHLHHFHSLKTQIYTFHVSEEYPFQSLNGIT